MLHLVIIAIITTTLVGISSASVYAAESRLKTRVLLEFGRFIPSHWEGRAITLAADFYALGLRPESIGSYKVEVFADQYYDIKHKLRADIYLPAKIDKPVPAVMLIHGGGWRHFSKTAMAGYGRLLATHGLAAVAVDYRLSTDARWPAQLEDLQNALAWLHRHAPEWRIDPERIATLGDSAGGHLAAMLAANQGSTAPRLRAAVGFYGVYDMAPLISSGEEAADNPINQLLPDASQETCRQASPITYVDENSPPFMLVHGLADSVVPAEQSKVFAERLSQVGVEAETHYVEDADHLLLGFLQPIKPTLHETDAAVIAFLRRHLSP